MSFPTYPKYKDSGVEWMEEVPAHWDVLATKRLFKLVVDPAPDDHDFMLLSIYTAIGVRPRSEMEAKGNRASTTDGYWKVQKGDLIVNKLLAWMGAIGVSEYDGVTSPAYDILRKKRPLDSNFYDFLFRCGICFTEFRKHSRGIMDMRLRLYFDALGQLPMPWPPVHEQEQIVKFLFAQTGKIDELVAEQQRLIELLKEKRQAVISHAVTKGLNPDAPMKPSGIEWLGDVPEHWEMKRLGWICSDINDINHEMPAAVENGVLFLSAKDLLDDGTLNFEINVKMISEDDYERLSRKVRPKRGDIIYSRIGAALGKARLVETDTKFNVSYSCCVVRVINEIACRQFIRVLLDGEMILTEARMRTNGIGVPDLGLGEIARFPIPLPPIAEQRAIVAFLERETKLSTGLMAVAERGIDLLQERRTALISAAVTGKIDVRGLVGDKTL